MNLIADAQAGIDVLNNYLLRQLSEDEIRSVVHEFINEVGTQPMKDTGKL